jgi:hypothetical protein
LGLAAARAQPRSVPLTCTQTSCKAAFQAERRALCLKVIKPCTDAPGTKPLDCSMLTKHLGRMKKFK